jgi:hypothetical protein
VLFEAWNMVIILSPGVKSQYILPINDLFPARLLDCLQAQCNFGTEFSLTLWAPFSKTLLIN